MVLQLITYVISLIFSFVYQIDFRKIRICPKLFSEVNYKLNSKITFYKHR